MTIKDLLQEIETATEAQLVQTLTFLQTLKQNTVPIPISTTEPKKYRQAGSLKGMFTMAEDFNLPCVDLDDPRSIEACLLEALESGPSTPMTQDDWDYIRRTVHENHRQRTNDRTSIDPDLANDPLFKLMGCLHSDIPDLADNHDYYIGQALYEEMHRNE